MLVVITIIGILAGLVVTAALVARRKAKAGAIAVELKSGLEHACIQYKEKFGEYPPDFAGITNSNATLSNAAKATIIRHLAKAFPRYVPGTPAGNGKTGWDGFQDDVSKFWNIDVSKLSPGTALVFWLGGQPSWLSDSSGTVTLPDGSTKIASDKPVTQLLGFSANAVNPFDSSTSRIGPFYDFDISSLGWVNTGTVAGIAYWSKSQSVTDKSTGPIVYFRAENGNYTVDGAAPPTDPTTISGPSANVKNESQQVWPAVDTRLSHFASIGTGTAIIYAWVNPKLFQIFASGLDQKYATPQLNKADVDVVAFPTGETYRVDASTGGSSYDDITNFSSGTLEDAMPQ